MSGNFEVIYVNGTPLSFPIFQSHILRFLERITGAGVDVHFLSVTSDADKNNPLYIANKKRVSEIVNGRIILLEQPSVFKGFKPMISMMKSAVGEIGVKPGGAVFHANSYLTGYALLKGMEGEPDCGRVFVDFKGILPQECLYYDAASLPMRFARYAAALRMEKYICRHAGRIVVVSEYFKKWLVEKRGVAWDNILVIPSCADSDIFRFDENVRLIMRKRLGYRDYPVVVYNGSLLSWQQPAEMFRLFKVMHRQNREARFLFLTPQESVSAADKLFEQAGILEGNYFVVSATGAELAGYLNAGDAGVLLRRNDLVNNVASPTKFGEYMGCGLCVLASRGIGDYSDVIEKNNFGMIIPNSFRDEDFEAAGRKFFDNLSSIRENAGRRSEWVARNLSWEKSLQTLLGEYGKFGYK